MNQQPCPFMSIAPPLLRPWVWLQLFFIQIWVEHHQRAVFMQMDKRTCRITIRYIGDKPAAVNAYTCKAPRIAAWERIETHEHLSATGAPRPRHASEQIAPQISVNQSRTVCHAKLEPG